MKPQRKPFIVEVKNRRRQPTSNQSIWGTIDLKAASCQVAVEQMARSNEIAVSATFCESNASHDLTDRST